MKCKTSVSRGNRIIKFSLGIDETPSCSAEHFIFTIYLFTLKMWIIWSSQVAKNVLNELFYPPKWYSILQPRVSGTLKGQGGKNGGGFRRSYYYNSDRLLLYIPGLAFLCPSFQDAWDYRCVPTCQLLLKVNNPWIRSPNTNFISVLACLQISNSQN